MTYDFDRFLRYEEMATWLRALAAAHPTLLAVESYGESHQGRELLLATITDTRAGEHHTKPAHWIDANIHAVEVTGGVAALYIIHDLVAKFHAGDPTVVEALRTRTFYIAPRVNPDGVEDALGDQPLFHRSSVRSWPWADGHRWPGLHPQDVDGDGRILTMRVADADGGWMQHPEEPRVMIPVGPLGAPTGVQRYRLLAEGVIENFDGFTIDQPRDPAGLDLNRNFPAGWGVDVLGSGDHPMSEPEVHALVRAVKARPNVCGYNAFHTAGGFMLRPSSSLPDSQLPPEDVFIFKKFGEHSTPLTTYPVHSVYEDLTWDKSRVMGGAGDDWAYDHLGVYSWTTEFWDAIYRATGEHSPTDVWYVGPTPAQDLAVCKWSDEHAPGSYVAWYPFQHPQLGAVELGGVDAFHTWTNAPSSRLKAEVAPHTEVAVYQAMASPRLEIKLADATALGGDVWRVRLGVANTGWLPTDITQHARRKKIVLPAVLEIAAAGSAAAGPLDLVEGDARVRIGQLEGRSKHLLDGGAMSDGTPDRRLHTWLVRASGGTTISLTASHQRAGTARTTITLGS
ncbi:MAG: M14 family metallopeptidase [Ilumatobacteraceae bacterium]